MSSGQFGIFGKTFGATILEARVRRARIIFLVILSEAKDLCILLAQRKCMGSSLRSE